MKWGIYRSCDDTERHVIPNEDLVEHTLDEDCVCGPSCEMVHTTTGDQGWLYVHSALDGRE